MHRWNMMAVALCALVAGCASVEQGPGQPRPIDMLNAADAQVARECKEAIPASAKELLAGKFYPAAGTSASIEMLANRSKPTEAEKAALLELSAARELCWRKGTEAHDRLGFTQSASIIRSNLPAIRAVYADLYGGVIFYGEANQRLEELASRTNAAVAGYFDALAREEAAGAEQRRLQALQMMQDWNVRNRTTQTNCVRVGIQTQCTTR